MFEPITLSLRKYIKIVPEYSNNNLVYYGTPYYYFPNNQSHSSEFDQFWEFESNRKSLTVASYDPVFIHTVYTSRPYSECKDWSIEEWECNHYDIGNSFSNFYSDVSSAQYDIPLDEIPDGYCYCVIAHYADNTAKKSSVMQK